MGEHELPLGNAPCYALSGFMSYSTSVAKHAENLRLVEHLEQAPYREAVRVADELWGQIERGRDWLRWNGAGDLTEGSVRVINALTAIHHDLKVWVISRKPRLAAQLRDRPQVRLMLSLDYTTPVAVARQMRELVTRFRHGVCRLAYTRTSEADIPPRDAYVVFNRHTGGHRRDWPHPKVCPATLPDHEHVDACDECRRCFR
jgi:hypothetical protein